MAEQTSQLRADPPNAVLAFAPQGGDVPEGAVVVLRNRQLNGDGLSYSIEGLDV